MRVCDAVTTRRAARAAPRFRQWATRRARRRTRKSASSRCARAASSPSPSFARDADAKPSLTARSKPSPVFLVFRLSPSLSRSTLESLPVPAPSRLSLTTRGRNSTYSLDPNRCSGLIYANPTINVFPCLCSLVSSSFSPPKHRSALLLSQSREALVRCLPAGLLACLQSGPPIRTRAFCHRSLSSARLGLNLRGLRR